MLGPGENSMLLDVDEDGLLDVDEEFRAANFFLIMAVRVSNQESIMTSWLSRRILKVRVEALMAAWRFCWLVWISSCNLWLVD